MCLPPAEITYHAVIHQTQRRGDMFTIAGGILLAAGFIFVGLPILFLIIVTLIKGAAEILTGLIRFFIWPIKIVTAPVWVPYWAVVKILDAVDSSERVKENGFLFRFLEVVLYWLLGLYFLSIFFILLEYFY